MNAAVLSLSLVLLVVLAASAAPCSVVVDGARSVKESTQPQTSISAHWSSFDDNGDRVLRYEWAIFSERLASPDILSGVCRDDSGFFGLPDVRDWEPIGLRLSVIEPAKLINGMRYYVVVRATTEKGLQKYASSEAVSVVEASVLASRVTLSPREVTADAACCSIDSANRERQARRTVGEWLNEMYGPPEFNQNSQATQLFRTVPADLLLLAESSSSSSSSPNGLHAGSIVGIALGVMGFCLIASCGLILLSSFKSKSDKFKTNINRRDDMDGEYREF